MPNRPKPSFISKECKIFSNTKKKQQGYSYFASFLIFADNVQRYPENNSETTRRGEREAEKNAVIKILESIIFYLEVFKEDLITY